MFNASDWKLLVVDDNPTNLTLLQGLLDVEGYKFATATNSDDALIKVRQFVPDLILLDIMMPGMDGLEVCEILKSTPQTADIPIIFVTAKQEPRDIAKGFETGGVDYVTKPYKRREVYARIRNQLELLDLRRSLKSQYDQTREALEGTLNGVVYILVVISSRDNPKLASQSMKLRKLIRNLASPLQIKNQWQLQTSALLSEIGHIAIPRKIVSKLDKEIQLSVD